MDRNTAKERIKQQISCTEFLQRARKGGYICPYCKSGTHKNGTGALKLYTDTNTWKCYACGKNGDVIDLYTKITGADYNTALQKLAARIGIDIDGKRTEPPQTPQKTPTEGKNALNNDIIPLTEKMQEKENKSKIDYTGYYNECKKQLQNSPTAQKYLERRGISAKNAAAYNLGFDTKSQRIIIPASNSFYVARTIKDGEKPRYKNPANVAAELFNKNALYEPEAQEVFITEGTIDALSIIEMGKAAAALNCTGNAKKLINALQERPTDKTLILCLDNDSAGQEAQKELASACKRLNITYITADISNGHKDPNEALTADPALFLTALNEAQAATLKPDNTAFYISTTMQADIARQKAHKITTCFENLNEKAGGIYSGLYIIAANTSIGKTTFTLQLADGIAASGTDVLYFSLEQSRLELVSKSLARYAAQAARPNIESAKPDFKNAPTSLQIRRGEWDDQTAAATIAAYKKDIGDRMSIIEGNFECDVTTIIDTTTDFIKRTNRRPVVIVDYFQILQSIDDRQSHRESIDHNVTQLKRLSRDEDITVILISSIGRPSYYTPFSAAALKESGGIEYTADCIWGLQLECIKDGEFTKTEKGTDNKAKQEKMYGEALAQNPRHIELICKKNRYGIANYDCSFYYYPEHDLFCAKKELCGAADGWRNCHQ